MQYREISLRVPACEVETAAAIANLVVPYGLYIEDYSDIEEMAPLIAHVDLIEQELLDRDREHAVVHLYIALSENPAEAISFLTERLSECGIPFTVDSRAVDEEDWATAWKKYYFPTKVGERLVVVPTWESYAAKPDEVILTMDPGMAFGTGTHDTTRLCMQLLERHVAPHTDLLDVGTGSGILAVAAGLLGARSALGIDIDTVAVRVAQENAQTNGMETTCSFRAGDLTSGVSGCYSVVTANIVADVIIRLLPELDRFLALGGVFIASGIIDARAQDVTDALQSAGYRIEECLTSGGWVALSARRQGD